MALARLCSRCYGLSSELVRYDQQPNLITHVGLVTPKPGVFVDTIKHLLVLCTPLYVQIIGVELTNGEMKLYETDITISTDAVEMTSVVGSKQGRIFMLGLQDGCLYELTYQASESWFTKKSGIVNHSTSGYASFIPSLANMIMPKLDRRFLFSWQSSIIAERLFCRSSACACL